MVAVPAAPEPPAAEEDRNKGLASVSRRFAIRWDGVDEASLYVAELGRGGTSSVAL